MQYFRRPTNIDDWEPELAIPAIIAVEGDNVTIGNIRDFIYTTRDDFIPNYQTRLCRLSELNTVDMIVSHWAGDLIAHVFLSFGFSTGQHIAISIEIRRRRTQTYSALAGFFRQYEIFYAVATEADLIGQRLNARGEAVYLYPLNISQEIQKNLFCSYLRRIQKLDAVPEFYNTLTNNCTTNIFRHANETGQNIPFNWRVLASGHADQYAYTLGILDNTRPFAALKSASRLTPTKTLENFSKTIRP